MTALSSSSTRRNSVDPRELVPFPIDAGATQRKLQQANSKPIVIDHPLAQHAICVLRDRHSDPTQLRYFGNQLLAVLAYEATAGMATREVSVETSKKPYKGALLGKPIIFLSLVRHGLGLAHNIADFIPNVSIGSITLDRSGSSTRLEPRLHLANAPALHEARIILFEPVVNSGLSATMALEFLQKAGASDLAFISFVTSGTGLRRMQANAPEIQLWTAAIDEDYEPKSGSIPGLGNFGERLYPGSV